MSEIKIQCPECHERFDVPEELMGNPVECGACQHPFDLSSEHVDKRAMRQFPGDKAKGLESFSKKTPEITPDAEVSFRTAAYDKEVNPDTIMPLGPRRLLAISAGIALMGMVILFFVLANGEQGAMADVTDDKRWVLAGFTALVGSLLLIFGFKKYRVFGVILTILLAAGVCSMPLIYPEPDGPERVIYDENDTADSIESLDPKAELEAYKLALGYVSVETKIAESSTPERVIAVALMRAKPAHLDTIKDYLARAFKTSEVPRVYSNRELNNLPCTLLVYLDSQLSIEDASKEVRQFGSVTKVRPDLQVIEVLVDTDAFSNSNASELEDEAHDNFYKANLEELKHIDPDRQLAAIQRLSTAKKFSLRSDIARQLRSLLESDSESLREASVTALVRWDKADQDNAASIIASQARKLAVSQKLVPQCYLDYVIEQQMPEVGDILLYAWMKEPVVHEATLVRAGKIAEVGLIELLPNLEPAELKLAGNVLRKIGTADALPVLLVAYESATGDVKKSLKATIDEIESRE